MTYREFVISTCKPEHHTLLHAVMGIAGESGEIIEVLKKKMFHKPETDINLILNELGDLRWYLELAGVALGITMEELEEMNMKKLRARAKNG